MIRVLVVDDSAVVREAMAGLLRAAADFEVEVAADPLIAAGKMARSRPDVILLDLEMPRMDGLSFLRKVMREDPIPVVVCSALTADRTELGLTALAEGAVAIVSKPRLGVRTFLAEASAGLVETLREAAGAELRRGAPRAELEPVPSRGLWKPRSDQEPLLLLGASTGGTEALATILGALPPDAPPVAVVQHMPELYTATFARRLNELSALEIHEARDGELLTAGHGVVAHGGHHLRIERHREGYVTRVDDGPPVSRHRPSVDVLFRSAARAAGPAAAAALLTGMGADGARGLLELAEQGATTIAQDEATSVVFGMPREAIALGAAGAVLPLERIAAALIQGARHGSERRAALR